jgi:hypothetical protein
VEHGLAVQRQLVDLAAELDASIQDGGLEAVPFLRDRAVQGVGIPAVRSVAR